VTAFATLTPERFDGPLYDLPYEKWAVEAQDYTVTVAGPERYDGAGPYTHVVRDHTTEGAWCQALAWHVLHEECLDVHVVASESHIGLPPADPGYAWIDLRPEALLVQLQAQVAQAEERRARIEEDIDAVGSAREAADIAARRIDLVVDRDPDHGIGVSVYLNGARADVPVPGLAVHVLDPGAGRVDHEWWETVSVHVDDVPQAVRDEINRLANGPLATVSAQEGLTSDTVLPIYQDRAGDIWIGTAHGLDIWSGGKLAAVAARTGLPRDQVFTIALLSHILVEAQFNDPAVRGATKEFGNTFLFRM